MILNADGAKPIYVQIAEWLEAEILSGRLTADEKMYSQYQLADLFNINPATAAKGLNLLAEEEIVYKKRGLGMFVAQEAYSKVLHKRKQYTLKRLVSEVAEEAVRLQVSEAELLNMMQDAYADLRVVDQQLHKAVGELPQKDQQLHKEDKDLHNEKQGSKEEGR